MSGERVVLDLACGRCGRVWMRTGADPDRPLAEQVCADAAGRPCPDWEVAQGAVSVNAPGSYHRSGDGWYRWTPGATAALPEGDTYARYTFNCPGGCVTSVEVRVAKLDDAALAALTALHGMRTSLCITVDALMRSAQSS